MTLGTTTAEAELLARLRAGDEQAFTALVSSLYGTMLTVARTYVKDRAVAEEVVQEAWLGVINGLARFEGRSSLKTWILSILVNQAKTRGTREARSVPFTALAPDDDTPAVAPERFRGPEDPFTGGWRSFPAKWNAADTVLQDRETIRVAMRAIAELPLTQQTVIRMRDVEGYSAEEVCATLDVTEANQRVLLHRARSRVRSGSRGTSMADGTLISCQEVVEVVTDYLEGRMSAEDVAIFEAHLDLCDGCKWYVEQMRITIATVGRIDEADVPEEMRLTLLDAFRRRV